MIGRWIELVMGYYEQRRQRRAALRRAWLMLAEEWRAMKLVKVPDHPWAGYAAVAGLCSAALDLHLDGRIAAREYTEVLLVIHKVPRMPNSLYCWPHTEEGRKQRVAFCEAQANRLGGR